MEFDIEAYLEEQVNTSKAPLEEKLERREEERNEEKSRRRDEKDRKYRRSSSRSPSRDRHRSSRRDDRDRSRDRYRDDKYRDRERDRDRDRNREKERSRDRDRERDKDKDREKDKDGEKRREMDKSRRSPSPEDPAEAEKRRLAAAAEREAQQAILNAERLARRKQQEIEDLTRDQRTILVSQLTMKVTESNLRNFFGQIGGVNSVIMIRDKQTGRHKGISYVEMADLNDIPNCLLFNNVVPDFQKFPILVKPSEAEKNFVARKDPPVSGSAKDMKSGPDCRLYLGNIHTSVTEAALRQLVEQFGAVEAVTLHRDEMGNSKGFAFVRFRDYECAQMAMKTLGGLELVGRPLKVGPVLDGMSQSSVGVGITNYNASSSTGTLQTASGNWKLDDDDGGAGMQMNAQSRVMLMAKLGQAAGLSVPTPAVVPNPMTALPSGSGIGPISGTPSVNIMIRNMFVLEEETSPDWSADIREDVIEECEKHGKVLRCVVETKRPGGLVYLKFASIDGAAKAAQSLHGRFFAGRQISAAHLDEGQFQALLEGK